MFLTHSDEALEIKKFKRSRENKIKFANDYGNLIASYVNEKINFEDDYFQEIINPDFKKIDSLFQQTSSLKPYVPNVILEKIIIDLEDEVVNLLEKEKVNLETIESLKSKSFESREKVCSESENQSENDCLVIEKECETVENPKVIAPGIFKLNVLQCVSPISMSKSSCDSKNMEIKLKRKRRKRKLSKQNVKQVDNDVSRANNDFVHFLDLDTFIFDDVNVRISPVSKMHFRKKPHDSMHVRSTSNSNKSLPRTVHKLSRFVFGSSIRDVTKHMTGNHALLMNFMEKFIGTVRFGNNDFAVIAGYGDVVIGSMTIKKVYYVEGLPKMKFEKDHLCSACEQGKIHRKHHKSKTDFASNKPLYLLHMDLCGPMRRVRTNNGTEFKNKTLAKFFDEAEAIATACFTQNRSIIHKCFDKTPYELINNRKPNIKFFRVFGCRCYLLNDYKDVGKLKAKGNIGVFVGYSKESTAFKIYNKRTRKIHESVNVNFDEISEMASKQFSLEPDLSNLKETRKSSNQSVSQVDESSKKDLEDLFQDFYDEYFDSSKIMKSSTMNVETPIIEEVFHESIPNNMVPNGDEASTSHNVFNKRLEDAYFDASTSFHDLSNVQTFYQPYPHEKKWTKDHLLH
uniref:Retroviral polymerase SH3-like domain-containing protein n=1 Tax=Tanacetum cinerariifolium TaxID=118510 RepID=A0A699JFQ2_TANCI|nr:hypothetical protein [Tanacetum cinerariifolium]